MRPPESRNLEVPQPRRRFNLALLVPPAVDAHRRNRDLSTTSALVSVVPQSRRGTPTPNATNPAINSGQRASPGRDLREPAQPLHPEDAQGAFGFCSAQPKLLPYQTFLALEKPATAGNK